MSLPIPKTSLPSLAQRSNLSLTPRAARLRLQAASGAASPDWLSPPEGRQSSGLKGNEREDSSGESKKKRWEWWGRERQSSLGDASDALPLPVSFTGSSPVTNGRGNAAVMDDKEVYEWTGKCRSCQGTGFASYYNRKGRETVFKCVACLGIGYVQKRTARKNAVTTEDLENSNPP